MKTKLASDTVYSKNFDGIPASDENTRGVKVNKKPMNFFLAAWRSLLAAKAEDANVKDLGRPYC